MKQKITIGPNITAGIRFEGDVLFGGSIDTEVENFDSGMSTRDADEFQDFWCE